MIEHSLSVDDRFVFALLFSCVSVPALTLHRWHGRKERLSGRIKGAVAPPARPLLDGSGLLVRAWCLARVDHREKI